MILFAIKNRIKNAIIFNDTFYSMSFFQFTIKHFDLCLLYIYIYMIMIRWFFMYQSYLVFHVIPRPRNVSVYIISRNTSLGFIFMKFWLFCLLSKFDVLPSITRVCSVSVIVSLFSVCIIWTRWSGNVMWNLRYKNYIAN